MNPFVKYATVYKETVKRFLLGIFKPEFLNDPENKCQFYIDDILIDKNGDFVFRLKKESTLS